MAHGWNICQGQRPMDLFVPCCWQKGANGWFHAVRKTRWTSSKGIFLKKAIGSSGVPNKVTIDKSGANKSGIDTINLQMALLFMMGRLFLQIHIRQVKYLNNIMEQDHRFIKKITKPIKGLKAFHSAYATLAGVELHHMLRKGQHIQSGKQTVFE